MSVRAHLLDVLLGGEGATVPAISRIRSWNASSLAIRQAYAWGVIALLHNRWRTRVCLPGENRLYVAGHLKKSFSKNVLQGFVPVVSRLTAVYRGGNPLARLSFAEVRERVLSRTRPGYQRLAS